MISCELDGKIYTIPFVRGRVLREMDDASNMYIRLSAITMAAARGEDMSKEKLTVKEALDVLVRWFCFLFDDQFTPDDVYDHYPADRIMVDIAQCVVAVQTQTTETLSTFPTKPAAKTKNG